MVACTWISQSAEVAYHGNIKDKDILELLNEMNNRGANFIIQQALYPRIERYGFLNLKKREVQIYFAYHRLYSDCKYDDVQCMDCASGTKAKIMAYMYGWLNGWEQAKNKFTPEVQTEERPATNGDAVGSIPTGGTLQKHSNVTQTRSLKKLQERLENGK